jgi:hypothetical protein
MKTIKASAFDDMHYEFTGVLEHSDGTREWFYKGEYHREDGPAIESSRGEYHWYRNDQYHREDGPAIERADGSKEWWLNGEHVYAIGGPIGDYIVVEDGLPSELYWMDQVVTQKKVLTKDGFRLLANLPGI